jgi:hypothetical protein
VKVISSNLLSLLVKTCHKKKKKKKRKKRKEGSLVKVGVLIRSAVVVPMFLKYFRNIIIERVDYFI